MTGPAFAASPRLRIVSVADRADGVLLKCSSTIDGYAVTVLLSDSWAADTSARPRPGDIARVTLCGADFSFRPWEGRPAGEIIVDDECNLFLLRPDTLISGTIVANSFVCLRKAVILARNPNGLCAAGSPGKAAINGMFIHELFQKMLVLVPRSSGGSLPRSFELPDVFAVSELVDDIVSCRTMDLYAAGVSQAEAHAMLMGAVPGILEWLQCMVSVSAVGTGGAVRDGKSIRNVEVFAVRDIEESVWSPVFGLKGKIDATVELGTSENGEKGSGVLTPLELKTGSAKGLAGLSHRAQVALYTLLMSDRYDQSITAGLLTYIRSGDVQKPADEDGAACGYIVRLMRGELVGLVQQRNALATYVSPDVDASSLPPLLEGAEPLCNKCFVNDSCMIQHRIWEGGDETSASNAGPGAKVFLERTKHLEDCDVSYYRLWRKALAAEEALSVSTSAELWTMSGSAREAVGRCWSGLRLVPQPDSPMVGKPRRPATIFRRTPGEEYSDSRFTGGHFSVGDFVVVSVQYAHGTQPAGDTLEAPTVSRGQREVLYPGLAMGFVQGIFENQVSISIDQNLEQWCAVNNFGIDDLVWRVDGEEIMASFKTAKATVEALFVGEEFGGLGKLRALVADLKAPRFVAQDSRGVRLVDELCGELKGKGMSLNAEQTQAVLMSRQAQDYLLLLGMPGTGKTSTLATIVLAAVRSGQSVLLCSHTRAAVDNVLSRLLDLDFSDFIRVGNRGTGDDRRIDPHHLPADHGLSVNELKKRLETPPVVATTCLGISHAVFVHRRKFDMVVVDEASQILQPICAGPIGMAEASFVLVGDHYQLPPLMRSADQVMNLPLMPAGDDISASSIGDEAPHATDVEGGPRESLFRRLCEAHPSAVVSLVRQYRMAEDIMHLSNDLVYSGGLSCATREVASRSLCLAEGVGRTASPLLWLNAALEPHRRVVFLNTDSLTSGDKRDEHPDAGRRNETEARIVGAAITHFVANGVATGQMAVLSPFRAQVSLLRSTLEGSPAEMCDICTIDQYQGKDKDCVFLSFVRSNGKCNVGPLLRDWRRINVAVTRARAKLILVGSSTTLGGGSHFLGAMLKSLKGSGSIVAVESLPS